MSLTDALRRAANAGRRVADKAVKQRPTTVTITVETYSDPLDTAGATLSSSVAFTLDPSPKVTPQGDASSWFGGGVLADAGGPGKAAIYVIGPITPSFSGGGYSQQQLLQAFTDATKKRILVTLAGDDFQSGGESFRIIEKKFDKAQSWFLTVERSP